jgi:hypothetical protein
MHISILNCGPGLLFIGLRWPSVQVEFDMTALEVPGSQLYLVASQGRIVEFICFMYYLVFIGIQENFRT